MNTNKKLHIFTVIPRYTRQLSCAHAQLDVNNNFSTIVGKRHITRNWRDASGSTDNIQGDMGGAQSVEIPGGGSEGYHVLRVSFYCPADYVANWMFI